MTTEPPCDERCAKIEAAETELTIRLCELAAWPKAVSVRESGCVLLSDCAHAHPPLDVMAQRVVEAIGRYMQALRVPGASNPSHSGAPPPATPIDPRLRAPARSPVWQTARPPLKGRSGQDRQLIVELARLASWPQTFKIAGPDWTLEPLPWASSYSLHDVCCMVFDAMRAPPSPSSPPASGARARAAVVEQWEDLREGRSIVRLAGGEMGGVFYLVGKNRAGKPLVCPLEAIPSGGWGIRHPNGYTLCPSGESALKVAWATGSLHQPGPRLRTLLEEMDAPSPTT